ncbi:MAG: PD-(D/E)XK nuclease family protein [Nitriliruptoraceae bacterium]
MTETPARQRLLAELLGWGGDRPVDDGSAAIALKRQLDDGIAALGDSVTEVAASARHGRLLVTKSRLDRLSCDGLAIDAEPFTFTWASVRGILTHAVVEHDWLTDRSATSDEVAAAVWHAESSRAPGDPSSLSAWMNALPRNEADDMRGQLAGLLESFREVWPPLDDNVVNVHMERAYDVPIASRTVAMFGRPDLVMTSPRNDHRARTLIVDLKTGRPRPEHDRAEVRFYALLIALATGRLPFRWATYYVQEGRYDVEDLRVETLEATTRRVIDGVKQQVRIAGLASGASEGLTIRAGTWCRFCQRRETCEVAASQGHAQSS